MRQYKFLLPLFFNVTVSDQQAELVFSDLYFWQIFREWSSLWGGGGGGEYNFYLHR